MTDRSFPPATGRVPPGAIGHNRGVVKRNYAFMPPEGVLISRLPHWASTVVRILAGPVLGAGFAQYVLEIAPGGGTPAPFGEPDIQHFYYVLSGEIAFAIEGGESRTLGPGGFAYLPPGTRFTLRNDTGSRADVLALRKRYEPAPGLAVPESILSHRDAVPMTNHTGMEGRGFQFLLPYGDMRFDFEMNLMWFKPGVCFPAVETHVMEHGLYMLEGQGLYFLDQDWHEIWERDFIWMGGFCPQQFYPTGHGDACYLLYKNVNRDVAL
ncbi:(S)-ureidoglycine aminohydrolase [Bosea sp. OAE752]|jgi:(S)-ureidoglycine aminohydrolase|uniref:(S)-ureidoglycine aminohydrolase n=1 Tax=Bosea spartocytisi TaxID=2773451 RepID=A0A927E6Y1_9HYPH|nr:(S)-ureidoglycine aminohydrolase [Bosea spartocytisi]MBD3844815.1 (S)-ureidoglycine aminohydrolase [Bosea spartocytisi]MCT4471017.1 (S)-ureidoglycine aminohydrolase [Bosea spartocytisi]